MARDSAIAAATPRGSPPTSVTSDGLDRDVGARPDRDADVGPGERRRVVDPVADHRDDPAVGLQLLDDRGLVAGQDLGADALRRDPDPGRDRLRRRARRRR